MLIKGFTYDGEGPDTFFLAGTGGRPSAAGDLVLPWPADGKQYQYRWQQLPLLGWWSQNTRATANIK